MAKKRGLYDNIQAKRNRIARGSGETMRKPGEVGAPTAKNFKEAAKTAKMNYDRNKVTGMMGGGKVPNKMKGFSKLPEPVQKKISPKLAKEYAMGGGVRKVRY